MNRNAVIFVIASMGILFGWQYLTEKLYPTPPPSAQSAKPSDAAAAPAKGQAPASSTTALPAGKPAVGAASPASTGSFKAAPEKPVRVETDAFDVTLSTWGARFTSLKLKGVQHTHEGKTAVLDLVPSADSPLYGALEIPGTELSSLAWTLLTAKPQKDGDDQLVSFGVRVPKTDIELVKTFRFPAQGSRFSVQVNAVNRGKSLVNLGSLALLWGPNLGGETTGIGLFPTAGVVQLANKVEREKAGSDAASLFYAAPRWVALKNHYFTVGLIPDAASPWKRAELRKLGADKMLTALHADGLSLQPGQSLELKASAYAGPQEYDALKSVGDNFQAVVQFQYYQLFDWLNPVSVGLLHLLKWFQGVTGNWGVAIILLTLVVRGLMFWPSLKSMVSMRRMQTKMAAMQPRLETLKKVYKDDPNKLNAEMMKLYKEYGVNPLGGCLPMLLQIPVFFALYGTLNAAFELRGAAFMWKWTDLTAGDSTYLFPLAMGVTMFLQQKLSPTSATVSDEQVQMQKMMLWIFPIMFTGMAVFMKWPVGLLLYWTASNIFGIVQQLAVNKAVD